MNPRAYGQAMFALLGLGTADLAALNLWAIPNLDAAEQSDVTDMSHATNAPPRLRPAAPSDTSPAQAPRVTAPALRAPVEETLPAPPAARIAAAEPAAIAARADVLFHRGTWWIGPAGRRALRASIAQLPPDAIFEVEGHADDSGPSEINQRISERRAKVVAELLVREGVDPMRIRKRALGESHSTGVGRDRRATLVIRGTR
jgi:outer membrane protein OmpA-like peptidoglycan-associated protein